MLSVNHKFEKSYACLALCAVRARKLMLFVQLVSRQALKHPGYWASTFLKLWEE